MNGYRLVQQHQGTGTFTLPRWGILPFTAVTHTYDRGWVLRLQLNTQDGWMTVPTVYLNATGDETSNPREIQS